MTRLSVLGLATAFLASACGGEPAAPATEQPAETPPAAAAPDPTMLPTPQQNSTAALSVTFSSQIGLFHAPSHVGTDVSISSSGS